MPGSPGFPGVWSFMRGFPGHNVCIPGPGYIVGRFLCTPAHWKQQDMLAMKNCYNLQAFANPQTKPRTTPHANICIGQAVTTPQQCHHCQAIHAPSAESAHQMEDCSTLSTPFSSSCPSTAHSSSQGQDGGTKTNRPHGSFACANASRFVKTQLCFLVAILVFNGALLLIVSGMRLSAPKAVPCQQQHTFEAVLNRNSWQSGEGTGKETTKPKVVLISALFGAPSVKPFLPFFLRSVENSDFEVLLFGDTELGVTLPPNVRHLRMSWEELHHRIITGVPWCFRRHLKRERLDHLPEYRKIIDYKPLFGMILQDEIREYDIWGHVDNDLVLGRLLDFLPLDVLASAEVIPYRKGERTTKSYIVAGPLTLFRNKKRVNFLFHRAKLVCKMLRSSEAWGFDEWFGEDNTNMERVILDAWQDPDFKLRLAPPHSGGDRLYDGDERFNDTQLLCEMQCPPSPAGSAPAETPSPELDLLSLPWSPSQDASGAERAAALGRGQCSVFKRLCRMCEKTLVVFCHFQHWKADLNSFLSNQTLGETLRLLRAETLQINRHSLVTAVDSADLA